MCFLTLEELRPLSDDSNTYISIGRTFVFEQIDGGEEGKGLGVAVTLGGESTRKGGSG